MDMVSGEKIDAVLYLVGCVSLFAFFFGVGAGMTLGSLLRVKASTPSVDATVTPGGVRLAS